MGPILKKYKIIINYITPIIDWDSRISFQRLKNFYYDLYYFYLVQLHSIKFSHNASVYEYIEHIRKIYAKFKNYQFYYNL